MNVIVTIRFENAQYKYSIIAYKRLHNLLIEIKIPIDIHQNLPNIFREITIITISITNNATSSALHILVLWRDTKMLASNDGNTQALQHTSISAFVDDQSLFCFSFQTSYRLQSMINQLWNRIRHMLGYTITRDVVAAFSRVSSTLFWQFWVL